MRKHTLRNGVRLSIPPASASLTGDTVALELSTNGIIRGERVLQALSFTLALSLHVYSYIHCYVTDRTRYILSIADPSCSMFKEWRGPP